MNAVRLFKSKIIGIKSISNNGDIIFDTEPLREQDIEDLSHLRMNVVNGDLFDDREQQLKQYFLRGSLYGKNS